MNPENDLFRKSVKRLQRHVAIHPQMLRGGEVITSWNLLELFYAGGLLEQAWGLFHILCLLPDPFHHV